MKLLSLMLALLLCCCNSQRAITSSDIELYHQSRVYKTFILPKYISDKYPNTAKAFMDALDTWEHAIPVKCKVFTGTTGPLGSISVALGNLHQMFPQAPEGVIGEFFPSNNLLVVDTARGDINDNRTFNVCLHELGHALGLPHIIGADNLMAGSSRDIILITDVDAKQCIMYPVVSEEREEISNVERLWAMHFLMHDITLNFVNINCNLELTKDEEAK